MLPPQEIVVYDGMKSEHFQEMLFLGVDADQ